MIPPEAWAKTLHMIFNVIALRRGVHWKLAQLPAEANPLGNGPLDEAQVLGEAISNVMKYVPLPQKELGVVNDLGTLAFVMYATVNSRLQYDRFIAQQTARSAARPAGPATRPAEMRSHHEPASGNGEVTAADLMATLPSEPLAAVTHEQTGDPVADGVQLGRSVTILQAADEDPEPALLEAFRPGEEAARVEDLVQEGGNVLDRLAPPIEVEGKPAAPELGG